ncbi:MAG: zinc ribbon domain-containing protein [Cyclobacteriaceae bacterium]|jgi:predicted nucleic-acid-binding Zn-ribbon protein
MNNNLSQINYRCPKCNNRQYRTETVSTTGGLLSKIFDVQHRKFTAVICERCTYTELYKTKSSQLANVFDFFTS